MGSGINAIDASERRYHVPEVPSICPKPSRLKINYKILRLRRTRRVHSPPSPQPNPSHLLPLHPQAAMCPPPNTVAEQVNTTTLLPTWYLYPQRANTFPLRNRRHPPSNYQMPPLPSPQHLIGLIIPPESIGKRWFNYLVGCATIIASVVAVIAVAIK